MHLQSNIQTAKALTFLQHAIQHDIEDIEDLDEFLAEDPEDCVHTLLGNAGCFY